MKKNDPKREQSTEAPVSELTRDQLDQVAGGTVNVQHTIVSPRDPASGLPTGKRMHKPFVT
jgi:type VI secretion system secreted protein Hcp